MILSNSPFKDGNARFIKVKHIHLIYLVENTVFIGLEVINSGGYYIFFPTVEMRKFEETPQLRMIGFFLTILFILDQIKVSRVPL